MAVGRHGRGKKHVQDELEAGVKNLLTYFYAVKYGGASVEVGGASVEKKAQVWKL